MYYYCHLCPDCIDYVITHLHYCGNFILSNVCDSVSKLRIHILYHIIKSCYNSRNKLKIQNVLYHIIKSANRGGFWPTQLAIRASEQCHQDIRAAKCICFNCLKKVEKKNIWISSKNVRKGTMRTWVQLLSFSQNPLQFCC